MKRSVILSIKKNFSDAIIDGSKIFELRKSVPKEMLPLTFFVYETKPTQAIVAMFSVNNIKHFEVMRSPRLLIKNACVTKTEFYNYFSMHSHGYALEITDLVKFKNPVPLHIITDILQGFVPPQNFRYISPSQANELIKYGNSEFSVVS